MTTRDEFCRDADSIGHLLAERPLIRAINFHNTPAARAGEYEQMFAHCREHFSSVGEDDLDRYLATGIWHKSRPGLLLAFYEGYRNGYDVILPLLEHYELTGWFFVITGFIDTPPAEQSGYASAHGIDMQTREYADGRYALSWDEIRELDRRHVIASHARSHRPIGPMATVDQEREVIGSQLRLTEQLGHPARAFVSWGGPAYGDDPVTDRLVDRAGYQFMVSNLRIQRLRAKTA